MTRGVILALATTTALSACAGGNNNMFGNRQSFDGQFFRVKLSDERGNPARFTVTVNDARRSLIGARDASVTKASQHCVEQFGRSDLTWDVSPDVEDAQLPIINGDLVMMGTCDGWR